MADKTMATADQPRVSARSVDQGAPSLQYRVSGIKSMTPRTAKRSSKRQ